MRIYRTSPPVNNPLVVPELPTLRWTYEQRAQLHGALNPSWSDGRGMKRRYRRELSTQRALDWRAELLAGNLLLVGRDRLRHSWRELMYSRVVGRAPALYDLRAKISARLGALVEHGPWSGWAIEDPTYGRDQAHSYARYLVPKASEKVWRWWRALARELRRLVLLLDRLFLTLVPPHHQLQEGTPTERGERSSLSRTEYLGQECRDQSLVELRVLVERVFPQSAA